MEDALKAVGKKYDTETLEKWGKSKSLRYYGGQMLQGIKFENLSKILNWNVNVKYVEYNNQSCGEVVIVGKGAEYVE